MTVIKDGTGTSELAKVDNENRIHTADVDIALVTHESGAHGLSFDVLGTTTIAASVEKTILVLINSSASTTIAIQSNVISIQGETGKPVTLKAYIGKRTYTSGGSVATPVNLNVGSPTTINVTAVQDNPTLGGSDSLISQAFLEATSTGLFDIAGAIILPPTASIRVTVMGDSTAAGTKIAATRFEYFALDLDLVI